MDDFLTQCTSGGCGAKIGAEDLSHLLSGISKKKDDQLLVGFDQSDDAAVYQLSDTEAIIQTVDFFSPMVDDPEMFGEIAAANALSDIYAMGGTPILALNIVCYPERLDKSGLEKMLKGGANKLLEANAVLAGGHSIYDHEPKYGLSVTGKINPHKIISNNTPQIGDALILTKALGVGIVLGAHRINAAQPDDYIATINQMRRLNKYAAESMSKYQVHAATDVTGFGLLGHGLEMAGDEYTLVIDTSSIPLLSGSLALANEFYMTAGGQRNRIHVGEQVDLENVGFGMQELLFDPQTSGGLLISIAAIDAQVLLEEIRKTDPVASIIGTVIAREDKPIILV